MARLRGKDISVLTIGSNAFAIYARDVEVTVEREILEAGALKDASPDRAEGWYTWTARFSKVIDTAQTPDSLASLLITGGTVTLTFTDSASGWTYSGPCLIARVTRSTPDRGAQIESIELTSTGTLTVTEPS